MFQTRSGEGRGGGGGVVEKASRYIFMMVSRNKWFRVQPSSTSIIELNYADLIFFKEY